MLIFFHHPFTGEPFFIALQQIIREARIESNKTELSEALKKTALVKGFTISDNQGRGNCMFFALSEQLDLIKGIKISHDDLRRTIVQQLRENPKLVSAFTYSFLLFLEWTYLRYMRVARHIIVNNLIVNIPPPPPLSYTCNGHLPLNLPKSVGPCRS